MSERGEVGDVERLGVPAVHLVPGAQHPPVGVLLCGELHENRT